MRQKKKNHSKSRATYSGSVAAYARVSSAAQSIRMQLDAVQRAAIARGDKITRWYTDKISGGTLQRPALAQLRAAARSGEIKKLYLFRIDRLTRTGIGDTLRLLDEFRAHGVEVVSVADGIDFGGPTGEIVSAVLAWAAQVERAAIGERIAAARKRVETEGGAWGRPARMTRAEIERARAARSSGATIRELAARFRVPRATIARHLKSKEAIH